MNMCYGYILAPLITLMITYGYVIILLKTLYLTTTNHWVGYHSPPGPPAKPAMHMCALTIKPATLDCGFAHKLGH